MSYPRSSTKTGSVTSFPGLFEIGRAGKGHGNGIEAPLNT